MLHKSIDLANANVFMQKLQPFAYSEYVPGRLPAKDRYAQQSYCSTFGQNMTILHIFRDMCSIYSYIPSLTKLGINISLFVF